jgi:predicted lipoprotein with Yx(FWY)xxD motif
VKRLMAVLVPLIAAVAVTGCGSSESSTTSTTSTSSSAAPSNSTPVEVTAKNISGVGQALVNSQGMTLYVFAPDKAKEVTCTSECATVWPPLKLEEGQKAEASGSVKQSLLGSDPNPEGGEVVTYAGWPLYTYVADTSPGSATGQGVNLNGGYWYAISPSGKVVK